MRRRTVLRSSLLASLLTVAAVLAGAGTAHAQFKCVCDYGSVLVDKGVSCKIELCFKTPSFYYCDVFEPGVPGKFKCDELISIYIRDCQGNLIELTDSKQVIPVGKDCCVVAVITRDKNDCLVVNVFPYTNDDVRCQC